MRVRKGEGGGEEKGRERGGGGVRKGRGVERRE